MTRLPRAMAVIVLLVALAYTPGADALASTVYTAADVSAADAAPFLGEWTLALQGPNGPGTFTLWITAEKEKVSYADL